MSVEGDLFRVTVKGTREGIVKMMNAVLKSFNSDNVIVESDDIETINSKLDIFIGQEGKDIGIQDLLGKENDVDVYRYLELVRIEDDSPGLIAKFSYYINEGALYDEDDNDGVTVSDWENIALQYNCQVFLDDDWYSNGRFIRFGSATIYDASDGDIRKLHLESGSIYDAEEYPFFVRTLAHLFPDHYGADWDHYHSNHPEVEISEEECLAWFKEQKDRYSETEEVEPGSLSQLFKELIDGNGHLDIPAGTRKILPNALMNCENLTSVVIPKGVTIIGTCSFLGCKNLKHVELPEGLRTIDVAAFAGCTSLKSIIIPDGIRIIAHGAFKDCSGLTSVVIPDSVTIIGAGAFEGCTCLTEDDISLIALRESSYDVLTVSTTVFIVGPKEAIVKVLNRAFRIIGSSRIVVNADASLEEINEKIREVCDHFDGDPDLEEQPAEYGTEFTLLDFLDDYNRMHSPCKDFVLSYIDEEYPDGTEDYGVSLTEVTEAGDEYIVKIHSQVYESQDSYLDEDWWDWCERMVRLYGCKVILHKESEVYESDIHDEETRLFDLDGDSVKQTMLDEFTYGGHVRETQSNPQKEDDNIPF